VDASSTSLEQHECGIHALRSGTDSAAGPQQQAQAILNAMVNDLMVRKAGSLWQFHQVGYAERGN
jgi:hypothetical protein